MCCCMFHGGTFSFIRLFCSISVSVQWRRDLANEMEKDSVLPGEPSYLVERLPQWGHCSEWYGTDCCLSRSRKLGIWRSSAGKDSSVPRASSCHHCSTTRGIFNIYALCSGLQVHSWIIRLFLPRFTLLPDKRKRTSESAHSVRGDKEVVRAPRQEWLLWHHLAPSPVPLIFVLRPLLCSDRWCSDIWGQKIQDGHWRKKRTRKPAGMVQ